MINGGKTVVFGEIRPMMAPIPSPPPSRSVRSRRSSRPTCPAFFAGDTRLRHRSRIGRGRDPRARRAAARRSWLCRRAPSRRAPRRRARRRRGPHRGAGRARRRARDAGDRRWPRPAGRRLRHRARHPRNGLPRPLRLHRCRGRRNPETSSGFPATPRCARARAKADFAARTDARMRIVTQFGFDGPAFVAWAQGLAAEGVDLPVHLGVAGPAKSRRF